MVKQRNIQLSQGLWLLLLAISSLLWAITGFAQTTPIGLWKTVDDDSGREKALVRIKEDNRFLTGKIEKLLDPSDSSNPICDECLDERHNKPILGMVILRHAASNDPRTSIWTGGDILDPENGKVYRVRLSLSEDGRRLDVRGYIGIPLFGRTQTWFRVE